MKYPAEVKNILKNCLPIERDIILQNCNISVYDKIQEHMVWKYYASLIYVTIKQSGFIQCQYKINTIEQAVCDIFTTLNLESDNRQICADFEGTYNFKGYINGQLLIRMNKYTSHIITFKNGQIDTMACYGNEVFYCTVIYDKFGNIEHVAKEEFITGKASKIIPV